MKDSLNIAVEATRLGASILKQNFGRVKTAQAHIKRANEWVSDVDRQSEEAMREFLLRELPDSLFLGEEEGQTGSHATYRWIVDPLDGTTNYLQGLPIFAVSTALERCSDGGEWGEIILGVVTNPLTGDLWTAVKGKGALKNGQPINVGQKQDFSKCILATGFPYLDKRDPHACLRTFEQMLLNCSDVRRPGAAALDLCWLAEGIFDGFWEYRLQPWDIAAGGLIIKEAGGIFTSFEGDDNYLSEGNVVGGNSYVHPVMLSIIRATADSA